jgi:acyl carrier protein
MSSAGEILRRVTELTIACIDDDLVQLDPDEDLAAVGLRSLDAVRLLIDLESTFSVTFPADMIDASTFRSIRTVATAVGALVEPEKL